MGVHELFGVLVGCAIAFQGWLLYLIVGDIRDERKKHM